MKNKLSGKTRSKAPSQINSWRGFFIKKEKEILIENLTLLLAAGLNISSSLEAVAGEIKSSFLKKVLAQVKEEVDNGSPLWRVLMTTKIFSPAAVALVRVGESSGRLADNLKIVADQNQKDQSFHSKLRSAMMYPTFILIIALVVAIGVSWFILPRLANVFKQMDIALPLITRYLIDFGAFLENNGAYFFPALIIFLAAFFYLVFFNKKTKFIGQSLIFATPGFKKLIQEVEVGRFAYLLGILLEAGIPIEEALESSAAASGFYRYRRLCLFLKEKIGEGESFKNSFQKFRNLNSLLPYPIQQMIVAGEQSGNLPDILQKIGHRYEEKTETTTKNLVIFLEPLMLIIVWLGVVGVALAIILPIYSLIGGMSQY
ncbi:MAG: type II secretion system F family protein [Patescibacteria group bacterium]